MTFISSNEVNKCIFHECKKKNKINRIFFLLYLKYVEEEKQILHIVV